MRRSTTTHHVNQGFEVEVTLRYTTPDNYKGAIIKIKGKHERSREHEKDSGKNKVHERHRS